MTTNPRQLRWDAQTLEAFQRRVEQINTATPWRQQTVAGLVREVLAKAAKEWEADLHHNRNLNVVTYEQLITDKVNATK